MDPKKSVQVVVVVVVVVVGGGGEKVICNHHGLSIRMHTSENSMFQD